MIQKNIFTKKVFCWHCNQPSYVTVFEILVALSLLAIIYNNCLNSYITLLHVWTVLIEISR